MELRKKERKLIENPWNKKPRCKRRILMFGGQDCWWGRRGEDDAAARSGRLPRPALQPQQGGWTTASPQQGCQTMRRQRLKDVYPVAEGGPEDQLGGKAHPWSSSPWGRVARKAQMKERRSRKDKLKKTIFMGLTLYKAWNQLKAIDFDFWERNSSIFENLLSYDILQIYVFTKYKIV